MAFVRVADYDVNNTIAHRVVGVVVVAMVAIARRPVCVWSGTEQNSALVVRFKLNTRALSARLVFHWKEFARGCSARVSARALLRSPV